MGCKIHQVQDRLGEAIDAHQLLLRTSQWFRDNPQKWIRGRFTNGADCFCVAGRMRVECGAEIVPTKVGFALTVPLENRDTYNLASSFLRQEVGELTSVTHWNDVVVTDVSEVCLVLDRAAARCLPI